MPLSSLELLPNELLDQIIFYLSTEPPSLTQLHHIPSIKLTHSPTKDIKHLSLCSSRFLNLIRPQLFNYARLDLRHEPEFHSFMIKFDLCQHVRSLVVIGSDEPDRPVDPFWWRQVLQYLDPSDVVVMAPPSFIGSTLGTPITNTDSWAFEIDLQILVLKQKRQVSSLSHLRSSESCTSLLATRPWTSMSFNESSSVKSYHHYEYFTFTVPSVLREWGANLIREERPLPQHHIDLPSLLYGLTYFSYTAVFPSFSHSQIVLDAILVMYNLKRLDVRLAPCPGNHITEAERGPMDPNDPWMELITSYSLIGYTVNKMKGLKMFTCNDLHVEAIRDDLLVTIGHVLTSGDWVHDGQGIFRRC